MDTIRRVMVIVAHPDDAESWAGGTVANLVRAGKACEYVVVTSGEKGSSDRTMSQGALRETREREQIDAARMLGVENLQFLRCPDCEVEDTRRLRLDVTREIRRFKPDLVIAQNPVRTSTLGVSHRDHRVVGGVVVDCVYPLAGLHLAFPELLPQYEPHQVRQLYVVQADEPGIVVDISNTVEQKVQAFIRYTSQIRDAETARASICERAARLGVPNGIAFAEGFDRVSVPLTSFGQFEF